MNDWLKYLIPAAFLILAGFNLYAARWLEGALYVAVGVAFPLMWAIRDGKIKTNLKLWNIVAWLLVFLALLLFFAVLQLDGHSLF